MSFSLNMGIWNSVFAVPSNLIDNYIKECDEYSLKLILILLKNPNEKHSKESICQKTGIPFSKFDSALNYWVKAGLISLDGSFIAPSQQKNVSLENKTNATAMKKMLRPDSIYISKRLQESSDLAHLFADAQAILGQTLSPSLSAVLIIAHDDYCLSIEVITMMISYCNSVGRHSTSFVEALARNWYELGISTIEQAETRINEMSKRANAWKSLCSAIGLPYRQAIKAELDLAYLAIYEMKFSKEMIIIAYEKTITATGKLQPKYMLKILQSWYKNKITNPYLLEKYEENGKAKNNTKNESSYNLNKFDELNVFDIKDV